MLEISVAVWVSGVDKEHELDYDERDTRAREWQDVKTENSYTKTL